jgi:hypothetical protein
VFSYVGFGNCTPKLAGSLGVNCCFVFGLFFGFFAWELGLGIGFFHVALGRLRNVWALRFPSRVNVCFVGIACRVVFRL